MSTLFPTITAEHWRQAFARGRTEGNALLAQMRSKISQGRSSVDRRAHTAKVAGSIPAPASILTAAGSEAGAGRPDEPAEVGGGEIPTLQWQPITGCSPVSPGCANCYAMKLAGEQLKDHPSRAGLTDAGAAGPVWNGELRFNVAWLNQPAQLTSRHLVYVCPHGDLFHENAPAQWIDLVLGVMERCPQHVFQILTKRAHIMLRTINARYADGAPAHMHFGVSCERQLEADQRIPLLLATRATVRYLTFFPLLGPISVRNALAGGRIFYVTAGEDVARPMNPSWSVLLAEACAAAGVPYYFGDRLDGDPQLLPAN